MAPTPPASAPADTTASAVSARFAGLDGLRAIAVLTVIVFHLSPSGVLPGGYLGVDIFFVISGFLITSLLVAERRRTDGIRLAQFWKRRARRLLPALGLLLITCCTAAWAIGGDALVGIRQQVLGAATFSSNWLMIRDERSYFDDTTPELFRNLWSLAVEEQFYLLWPLILLALLWVPRRWMRAAIVGGLGVASAVAMAVLFVPGHDASRVYYGTDTHSFGLAFGAVLALLLSGRVDAPGWKRAATVLQMVGLVSVVALIAAAFVLSDDDPLTYRFGLVGVAAVTTLAILGSVLPGSRLGHALDRQPLRWVGERSYGLYLWHWPVFILVVQLLPGWQRTGANGWLIAGIAAAVTAAAATLSYRWVEQPIRRLGFRGAYAAILMVVRRTVSRPAGDQQPTVSGSRPRLIALVAAGALVLAGVGGVVASIATDPGQGSVEAQIELGQKAVAEQKTPTPGPIPDQPASPAELPGGDQITAIGDSVMLASAPELQAAFPGIQIDAVVSRQLSQAPAIVASMLNAGTLRPTVLIGLGTNGPIDHAVLMQLRALVGASHQIVLVNVFAPRWWTDGVNVGLSVFAQQYRNVELANWRDAISGQVRLLAGDQIHPGNAGGQVYVGAVRDALQRLSDLPPVLTPRDYGLAPVPS